MPRQGVDIWACGRCTAAVGHCRARGADDVEIEPKINQSEREKHISFQGASDDRPMMVSKRRTSSDKRRDRYGGVGHDEEHRAGFIAASRACCGISWRSRSGLPAGGKDQRLVAGGAGHWRGQLAGEAVPGARLRGRAQLPYKGKPTGWPFAARSAACD